MNRLMFHDPMPGKMVANGDDPRRPPAAPSRMAASSGETGSFGHFLLSVLAYVFALSSPRRPLKLRALALCACRGGRCHSLSLPSCHLPKLLGLAHKAGIGGAPMDRGRAAGGCLVCVVALLIVRTAHGDPCGPHLCA